MSSDRCTFAGLALLAAICGCAPPTLLAPAQSDELRELAPVAIPRRAIVDEAVDLESVGQDDSTGRQTREEQGQPGTVEAFPLQIALGDPAIGEIGADISLPGDIKPPDDLATPVFKKLGRTRFGPSGISGTLGYENWRGGAFCHQPLYFEEYYLERQGRSWGVFQPLVSGAHFFATVPAMPYLMTVDPPRRCSYVAGIGPRGEPLPYHRQVRRPSLSGALAEAGVITSMVFILP